MELAKIELNGGQVVIPDEITDVIRIGSGEGELSADRTMSLSGEGTTSITVNGRESVIANIGNCISLSSEDRDVCYGLAIVNGDLQTAFVTVSGELSGYEVKFPEADGQIVLDSTISTEYVVNALWPALSSKVSSLIEEML